MIWRSGYDCHAMLAYVPRHLVGRLVGTHDDSLLGGVSTCQRLLFFSPGLMQEGRVPNTAHGSFFQAGGRDRTWKGHRQTYT